MDYKKHVVDLKNKCDAFLRQVDEIGNECAWTDCAVEEVLKSAESLHQAYYGQPLEK